MANIIQTFPSSHGMVTIRGPVEDWQVLVDALRFYAQVRPRPGREYRSKTSIEGGAKLGLNHSSLRAYRFFVGVSPEAPSDRLRRASPLFVLSSVAENRYHFPPFRFQK